MVTLPPTPGLIYIASPYSDPDPYVRDWRYRQVRGYVAGLLRVNYVAFSPIVYGHTFTKAYMFPIDFEAWKHFNHTMLEASVEMWVLKLEGWDRSRGIADEVEFCREHKKPIFYVEYAGYENL